MNAAGHETDAVVSPRPPADPGAKAALHLEPPVTTGRRTGGDALVTILLVAATLGLAYGLILRIWLLVQLPIWGDEAIVGIMARAIDGGHFTAFYLGQHYGGLEPYLVALGLKVGGGEPALNATPAVLSAIAAGLVGGRSRSARPARPGSGPTS
jgi:hypothetical protein